MSPMSVGDLSTTSVLKPAVMRKVVVRGENDRRRPAPPAKGMRPRATSSSGERVGRNARISGAAPGCVGEGVVEGVEGVAAVEVELEALVRSCVEDGHRDAVA